MADALLPCPFCGEEPMFYDIEPHTHNLSFGEWKMPDHTGSSVIECGCGCGLIDGTRATVIERWNRRATQPQRDAAPAQPLPLDDPRLQELSASAILGAMVIEHAGYMATAAEALMRALNDEDAARLRREESDDVDDDTVYDAGTTRSEYATKLRSAIYEFRKRRDRVAIAAHGTADGGA